MGQISVGDILIPIAVELGLVETELMKTARQSVVGTSRKEITLFKDRYAGYQALAGNIIYGLPDEQKPAAEVALQLYCAVIYAERGKGPDLDDLDDALLGVIEYAKNLAGTPYDHPALAQAITQCRAIRDSLAIS